MGGRDRDEAHRAATPLELLFDLTFVVAFGMAASQLAHAFAEGNYRVGLLGFGLASFGICWAWTNFSWFASAYDTDDWIFRIATMVQMIGVLILALGLPRMFASLEHGEHVDPSIMVLGYVVMRVALVFQWLRAARQDGARRRVCLTYAFAVSLAQIGWAALIFAHFSIAVTFVFIGMLAIVELAGPVLAERKDGGTPWHAHHMVERLGLFAIIALGEGVVGTVAALSAVVEQQGWTLDAALVGIAGTGLTFGMWWVYYMLPSAEILHVHRERSFVWGYGQLLARDGDRRHRRRASRRGVFHRARGSYQCARDRPHRRDSGRRLPRAGLCALLLSRSTIRSVPHLVADGDGRSRRRCGSRGGVRHQHGGLSRHPHAGAGRHGRRLRSARIPAQAESLVN